MLFDEHGFAPLVLVTSHVKNRLKTRGSATWWQAWQRVLRGPIECLHHSIWPMTRN